MDKDSLNAFVEDLANGKGNPDAQEVEVDLAATPDDVKEKLLDSFC